MPSNPRPMRLFKFQTPITLYKRFDNDWEYDTLVLHGIYLDSAGHDIGGIYTTDMGVVCLRGDDYLEINECYSVLKDFDKKYNPEKKSDTCPPKD